MGGEEIGIVQKFGHLEHLLEWISKMKTSGPISVKCILFDERKENQW